MKSYPRCLILLLVLLPALPGCRDGKAAAGDSRPLVEREMKAMLSEQLEAWARAADRLSSLAPEPRDRGWSEAEDSAAIDEMRAAWHAAREAYELIEGAIAPMFPESDAATDARYDDFLVKIGPVGDPRPFDDEGVVGMHAIERVLWANAIPTRVVEFERGLPGYAPARFPETPAEAADFKEKLVGRLIRDIKKLRTDFEPLSLDVAFAFQGLIDLAAEQAEKVNLAATGQEESRYAQSTMRDLRANYQGCFDAYRIFQPWVLSKPGGVDRDRAVLAAFERLRSAYAEVAGDAIPAPPSSWSSVSPRAEHADTPFGRLFHVVRAESDPEHSGSLIESLYRVAELLALSDVVVR